MKKKKLFLMLVFAIALTMFIPIGANAKVKINKKKVTLTVGQKVKLKVKGTKKKVTWKSKKKSVATVNKKGKVTAKRAGTATIIAKAGKKKYKCKVTVKAASPVMPSNPSIPQTGTKEDPIPLSSGYAFTYMDKSGTHTIRLKLLETIDNADAIVHDENKYNEKSDGSDRWVLYHYRLEYFSGTGKINASDIINKNVLYDESKTVNLGNSVKTAAFSGERAAKGADDVFLYPYGSSDVWFGILVDKNVSYTHLNLRWYDNNNTARELWFKNQ